MNTKPTRAQPKAASRLALTKPDTTWMERFQDALTIMCGAVPPLKFCELGVDNVQDEHAADPLQNWVGMQKLTPKWAQCIVTIDAAILWAETPVEGEQHQAGKLNVH